MITVICSVILSYLVVTSQGHRGLGSCECKAHKLVCYSHGHDISQKYHSRRRNVKLENLDNVEDNCPSGVLVKLLKLKNHQIQRFLSLNLTEVIFLEISYSKTFKLSKDMFNNTKKMKELTLLENKIHSLSENIFTGVQQLKMLNLNGNKLRALNRSDFSHLDPLQELHLRDNKIASIENLTFVHLRHLILLNLANNRLRHVTAMTFRGLTQLKTLILSRNQIIYFQPKLLEDLISLRRLYLTGNPVKIFPRSSNQLKVIRQYQRKSKVHQRSYYIQWPIALGFLILPLLVISSVFIIKWVRNNLGKGTKKLRLYLLHAQEESAEFVSDLIAQISREIQGDILTRENTTPGKSVIREAIRMVTESDVLVILISKHQDSFVDLVISRSGFHNVNMPSFVEYFPRFCDSPIKMKQKVS